MKRLLHLIPVLATLSLLSAGCMAFVDPQNGGTVPVGQAFYTNVQGLTFYFVDAEGKDRINFDNRSTWPLAYPEAVDITVRESAVLRVNTNARSDGAVFYIYNDNCNALCQDYESKLWGFSTYFWGRTPEPEYTTLFYEPGGAVDSVKVKYTYLDGSDGSYVGSGWAVKVNSVKYNDVEVFDGNENGKVFIQKPSQGETVVKVGRL